MSPTYGINSLPDVDWQEYVKAAPTRMCRVAGPCTIYTLEGPLDMPAGWEGWLAVDSKGHPYPIDDEVHAATYAEGGSPRLTDLFDADQLDVFAEIRQTMLDNEAATGNYTIKSEVRQRGCSVHYKWPKQVDVLTTASEFVAITDQAPGKLFWVLDKILTAAGRPLPED